MLLTFSIFVVKNLSLQIDFWPVPDLLTDFRKCPKIGAIKKRVKNKIKEGK